MSIVIIFLPHRNPFKNRETFTLHDKTSQRARTCTHVYALECKLRASIFHTCTSTHKQKWNRHMSRSYGKAPTLAAQNTKRTPTSCNPHCSVQSSWPKIVVDKCTYVWTPSQRIKLKWSFLLKYWKTTLATIWCIYKRNANHMVFFFQKKLEHEDHSWEVSKL